jgi:hypothetical protein
LVKLTTNNLSRDCKNGTHTQPFNQLSTQKPARKTEHHLRKTAVALRMPPPAVKPYATVLIVAVHNDLKYNPEH